jgi:hypothetical protein
MQQADADDVTKLIRAAGRKGIGIAGDLRRTTSYTTTGS